MVVPSTSAASPKTPPAKSLLPSDWAAAALVAIADGGIEKLSVERLAKSIGVTKGSFYWHFSDRAALIEAAALEWECRSTDEVIAVLSSIDDPRQRLRTMFEISFGDSELGPIDTALAAKADDPVIGGIVRRVTKKRVESIESIFLEIGLTVDDTKLQARLAYAAYLGHFQLGRSLDNDPALNARRSAYLDHLVNVLVRPPDPPASTA